MIAPLHQLFDDFEAETDQKIVKTSRAPAPVYHRYYFGLKAMYGKI
jgi:hypothetical protein